MELAGEMAQWGEDVCCLVAVRTETLDSQTSQKSWASVVATFNFRTGQAMAGDAQDKQTG